MSDEGTSNDSLFVITSSVFPYKVYPRFIRWFRGAAGLGARGGPFLLCAGGRGRCLCQGWFELFVLGMGVVTDEGRLGGGVGCVTNRLFARYLMGDLCIPKASGRGTSRLVTRVLGVRSRFVDHVDRARPKGMGNFCGGLHTSFGTGMSRVVSTVNGLGWSRRDLL